MEKTVQKLNWRTFMSAKDETPEETIRALTTHFEHYVQPTWKKAEDGGVTFADGQPCVSCGKDFNPDLAGFLLNGGGFEWGLVHGEGRCSNCGWPATGHHFVKDENGDEVMTLRNFVLQYHPDFVEKKSPHDRHPHQAQAPDRHLV